MLWQHRHKEHINGILKFHNYVPYDPMLSKYFFILIVSI